MSSQWDQLRTQVFPSPLSSACRSIRWTIWYLSFVWYFTLITRLLSWTKIIIFFLFGAPYAYFIIHTSIGRLWTWTRRTRSWRQIVGSLKSGTTLTSLGTSQVVRILHRFVSVYICWHIWQIFHTSSIQILVEWGIFGFPFRRSGGQMWYFTTSKS